MPSEWSSLQRIGHAFYTGRMTRDEARSAVVEVVIDRLHCSRVSLWRFDGEPGALRLLCFASKVATQDLVTTEHELRQGEYSRYFDGLIQNGMYVSDDAMNDANLQPMRAHYLVKNNVHSMLDAAFLLNGRAYGMVCCEQTDRVRAWRADEMADLRGIVAKLALLMASGRDENLWRAPSLPLRAIHQDTQRAS